MPLNVLIAIQSGFDLLDAAGPLETLFWASHTSDIISRKSPVYDVKTCGPSKLYSEQPLHVTPDLSIEDAHAQLANFDVLVIPGGSSKEILDGNLFPIPLLRAFADLEVSNPTRQRTILSVCTGAVFLARAGVLNGLSATTNPEYMERMEENCKGFDVDVRSERVVVNRPGEIGKGQLRIVTAGGPTTGIDAALKLVEMEVGRVGAERVAKLLHYDWNDGAFENVY